MFWWGEGASDAGFTFTQSSRERYAQLNATLSVGSDSFLCVCGENAVLSSLIFMPRAAADHSQSISALDPSRFIHSASATQRTSLGVGEGGRDIGEICRVSLREEGGRPARIIWADLTERY